MVNKCSAIGCRSLYTKENVKLHRFPLTNNETLPSWIAATGRKKEWKPCKSSRLCCNHFQETEYIVGHGKGVLKSTAVPTIDYRVENPRYQKKKVVNLSDIKLPYKPIRPKPPHMDTSSKVEVYHVDDNDTNASNKHIKQENSDYLYSGNDETYYTNGIKEEKSDEDFNMSHTCTSFDNDDQTTIKLDNSIDDIKKEFCNRENQCYMFTSSFQEGADPIVTSPPNEKSPVRFSSVNINQSSADIKFNKIMALKCKKQKCTRTKDIYSLYFKSLKKRGMRKTNQVIISINEDTGPIGSYVETQMKELQPFRKLYLTTKHKIQKLLMRALLKVKLYNQEFDK